MLRVRGNNVSAYILWYLRYGYATGGGKQLRFHCLPYSPTPLPRLPDQLIKQGIRELPTLGDGRQSGTSGSPSILNVSPESAVGGGLAILVTGDAVRIDLNTGTLDVLLDDDTLDARRQALEETVIENQTPWQEIYRSTVGQLAGGGIIELAAKYQRIRKTLPRHSY